MKKRITAKLLTATGMMRPLAAMLPARGVLVLNYHRVGDGSDSPYDRELWSASAEGFDDQVAFLARHCDVIAPADIDHALRDRRGRHVVITFDDGYLDNYQLAFPILQRHRVPATFFIATGFIDHPALPWWDEIAWLLRNTPRPRVALSPWFAEPLDIAGGQGEAIRAVLAKYKSLPSSDAARMLQALRDAADVAHPPGVPGHWMDWDMIRDMARNGMTIGGHTVHHPVLSRMPREQQQEEIAGCAARILAETGLRMEYFAYPVGNPSSFNADTVSCLEAMDVRHAFSYYGGYARRQSPRFDIPRVAIESHTRPYEFEAMARLPQVFCSRPNA